MSPSCKSYKLGDKETCFASRDRVFLIHVSLSCVDVGFAFWQQRSWEFDFILQTGALIIVRLESSFRLWKNCSLCIYILTANPLPGSTNLDTKSLSILRACFVSMSDQWNGDAPCKSLRLLWTENADSLNDGNKTEHQLGWFTQIWGNFSRSKSCKNKQFQQKMMLSAV